MRELYFRARYSDRALVERQFRAVYGRNPDLKQPRTFNEKLQWLKLNWRDELATMCADKGAARDYVAERVGGHVLTRTYGLFSDVEEIPWDSLPERVVLKATHGSGWNIICKNRAEMDWNIIKKQLRIWLRSNHYWKTREWVYRDIPPRIIVEEFLTPEDGLVPWDYKVFCFHGKPTYIEVDIDRFGGHRRNIYDTEWNLLPVGLKYPRNPDVVPPVPPLRELLEYSAALAEPFPHVRVDWFLVDGALRFGEMTFFHGMGRERFSPAEWDVEFGKHLDLTLVASASGRV
jgi:hypothetical protein